MDGVVSGGLFDPFLDLFGGVVVCIGAEENEYLTADAYQTLFALGTRQAMEAKEKRKRGCTWKKLILVYVFVDDKHWP